MNLATKTIALLAAIVFTVLATVSFFLLHYHGDSLKRSILDGVDGQAKMAAHSISSFIDEGLRDSRAVSLTLPVKALSAGRTVEVESYLKQMFETFPKFQNGIFILDREGRFMADYPPHPELRGESFAFREYYRRTIQENRGIVGKPYKSKRTGMPVLTFTAPVRDAHGKITAIVACSVDLLSRGALDNYRKQKFGKTGYLYLFDKTSRLLVLHPEDKRLFTEVAAGKNKMLDAAMKGFEGSDETVNSVGVPMLLAVRNIPGTDWVVGVQLPQEEAYAPIRKARTRIFIISGLALLGAIIIGTITIRHVSGPISQLERVASYISSELKKTTESGELDLEHPTLVSLTSIRSRDEIGLLASSFLQLVKRLGQTLGSLQRSAEDWQRTFNSVHEAVVTLDTDGRIVKMNQIAEDWFRTSIQKVRGKYGYSVIFGASAPPSEWPNIDLLVKGGKVAWSQRLEKPSGIFELTMTPITYRDDAAGAVLAIDNITERAAIEEQIREMAFYDQLTGLPNRLLLLDRLQQAIASAIRCQKKVGIMFIDIDRFKEVNDKYGHNAGDNVLREVARRNSSCLRLNDTFARLGGDEFVVVLQDIEDTQEAVAIAERIIVCQSCSVAVDGHELNVSLSIGIAFFPEDGEDSETLIKKADMAMYSAKACGGNTYRIK